MDSLTRYKLVGWGDGCAPVSQYAHASSPDGAFAALRDEFPVDDLYYLMVYETAKADDKFNGWIGEIMLDTLKFRSKEELRNQNFEAVCDCLPVG